MADMNINVGANTRQAERDIQKLVNRNYNINLSTKGGAPLGRITGQVNEFTKSLDASNARVIAFGASAGIIFGVQRAFGALVTSVIETQKSLADINVILNVSTQNLQKFGGELFNIAKNTGQSFQDVAKAATEFSRQGLGVEETLKRTNQALILSRLSGLDAAKSVEALTAAVNSYASQAVTASEVVNKFANVDAAFAVSSADLAEALARVGSSAAQSGVGLNELIAIVTSAQQTTARGGAVIGNSFKTIFTRLQRTKVIDLLDNLGVNTKDSSGEIKSTINLLTDLAKVYDQLGTLEQADVAEKVGGVFQINILKAALADLGKEYSIYNSALQVAGSTTDQAIRRNAELNKTYAAQLNALRENSQQIAAGVGQRIIGPAFDRVVGNANALLGGVNESDGQGIGATLGKGILDGLGQVIAGPGLALIGGVFIKLFADLSKFAGGSLKELLNLNSASKQQQALQQSVNQILQKNPDLFKLMSSGTAGLNKGAEILLNSLRAQTLELQKQEALSAKIAAQFIKTGGVRVVGGIPTAPTPGKAGKAAGYIPNFASDKLVEKYTAISLGATSSVRPHMSQGTIGGRKFVMNNQEVEFPGVGKNGDSMVIPTYGDGPSIAASGFIPNFANFVLNGLKIKDTQMSVLKAGNAINIGGKNYTAESLGTTAAELKSNPKFLPAREKQRIKNEQRLLKKEEKDIASGRLLASNNEYAAIVASPGEVTPFTQKRFTPQGEALRALKGKGSIKPLNYSFNAYGADSFQESSAKPSFEQIIENNLKKAQQEIVNRYQGTKGIKSQRFTNQKSKSQVSSFAGFLFEDIVASFLKSSEFDSYQKTAPDARFDFKSSKTLQDFFGIPSSIKAVEAKLNTNPSLMTSASNTSSIANKIYAVKGGFALSTPTIQEREEFKKTSQKKLKAAAGYIPNFAAISDVMALETAMSGEKAIFDTKPFPHVRNKSQPTFGSAMADHGGKKQALKDSLMGQKRAGLASGFIPNFAAEDTAPTDIGSSITALTAQLGGLAFILSFNKGQYKTALEELTKSTKQAAKEQLKATREQIRKTYQTGPGGFVLGGADPIKAQEEASRKFRQQASPFTAKAGAAIGTNAIAISLLGPILAETLANAIGKEDKTSRVASSGASGLGQAATFAGFGAMLTPAMPLLGAGIGAAAGGLLGLVDVIKQASTDIPELSAAAQKASENLTKINDAGQKVQTSFEQIQGLRESGQGGKAGQLESELLSLIRKEFKDTPELVSGAATAVINQDFISLQKVLGENTIAIQKNTLAKDQELLAGRFIEGFGGKDSFKQFADLTKIEDISLEGLQELQNILNQPRDSQTTVRSGAGGVAVVQTVNNDIFKISEQIRENLNKYSESFASLPIEFQNQIIEAIREGDIQDISRFLQELGESIKNGISIQDAINRNSGKNNKIIALITKTLQTVQSNYAKLARQTQSALDLQLIGESSVRNAQTNIRGSEFETKAVQEELFGITTPAGRANSKTQGEISKIDDDFANTVKDSVGSTISLIGSAFIERQRKSFDALSTIGGNDNPQKNAEANLETARALAEKFGIGRGDDKINETFINRFKDILGDIGTEGFKVEEKLTQIAKELQIASDDAEGQKRLDLIRDSLNKNNQEVVKSRAVLIEQKTLLANLKFQESLRELITSINGAFGGLEAFITNDTTTNNELNKAIANLKIIGQPSGEKSIIEVGRNLQRVVSGLSKITGRNIGPELGPNSQVIQGVRQARSLDIENQLTSIIRGLGGIEGDRGKEILSAFRKSLEKQAGIDPRETAKLSGPELIKRYSETVAKQQVDAENKTGQLNQALIDQAKLSLPPELRDLLDVNADFLPIEQIISAQFSQANNTLQLILQAINNAQYGTVFKPNRGNALDRLSPEPEKPDFIPNSNRGPRRFATGYVPPKVIPAMMAESRDIANGVGGALPTDRPEILRNFNGKTVVGGSGETVEKNFMGTGKSAILTREMQDAMAALPKRPMRNNMSMGFIPNFALGSEEALALITRYTENLEELAAGEFREGMSPENLASEINKTQNELDNVKRLAGKKAGLTPSQIEAAVQAGKANYKAAKASAAASKAAYAADAAKGSNGLVSKGSGKAAGKAAGAAGAAGKGVAKGIGKGILKQIPVAGTLLGLGFAAYRLAQGDYIGAGLEASSTIPGLGIGSSAALIAYDMQKENEPVAEQSYGNQQTTQAQQQNQKELLAEQPNVRREATKRREAKKVKPSVNMPVIPTALDFANAATSNIQQTQLNKQITTAQTTKPIKPTNPYRLIGGTGNSPATQVDRRTGTGTTVPRAESVKTSQPSAKFMMQSLVEAYTKALSGQEGFYNRPTGEKMDQKRALMAKVNEFKRLYEQGKYESLKTIYNKHQKSDPVKDAYASYKAKGIDPNAGYDAAMRAAGLDPSTGAPIDGQKTYFAPGGAGLIDGRPVQEVLAEGRANRPSDPAYDSAMRAAGLDPSTGAPIDGQKTYFAPGGAGLIDGRPAQEVLDEMKKENASSRVKNYAQGLIPKIDSFMNEMSAGFNPSEIYPKKQPELQGLNNPQGDAYFNKPEEGTTAKERIAMGNRMNIPGFANSIPESAPASINLGGLTINEAQTGGKSKEYSADFAKDWEVKASALALQIKGELDQKYGRAMEIVAAGERKGSLPRVPPKSRGLV